MLSAKKKAHKMLKNEENGTNNSEKTNHLILTTITTANEKK